MKQWHKNSEYRYVQGLIDRKTNKIRWVVHMHGVGRNAFETERDAAIAVDKILISKGKEPVNILIRK
jgi:hypothetical protein